MKQLNVVKWKWLLAPALVLAISNSSAAEPTWKDEFIGCSGTSPFINNLIKQNALDVRPLMKIGTMQAWAMMDENGKPTLALTTEEGLIIVGKVIGPQGEDISGALLATIPDQSLAKSPATGTPDTSQTPTTTPTSGPTLPVEKAPQLTSVLEKLNSLKSGAAPAEELNSIALSGTTPTAPPPATAFTSNVPTPDVVASVTPDVVAITAVDKPTREIQAALDQLLDEATSERLWFSAGQAQPGVPVIYMLTDPDCPHCQWAIDSLHSKITSGQIDLRIIPAPITGPDGFTSALSIVHSDDVAKTFMNHMTSNTRGTPAVTQMDTKTADKAVIQAIAENINWMRRNRIGSVPFFFYKDATGAKFSASALPENILQVAKTF